MTRPRPLRTGLPLLALVILLAPSLATAQTKLLRFPDIHANKVVFCYAGDLWTAPAGGGSAVRLTTHPGQELFPRFSPDGKWIAFTGQIDGDEQVYVIPSTGGVPKQLTFYPARGPLPPRWGYDNQVYGWTPDGEKVLFRSLRDGWDLSDSRLYTVGVEGGLPEALAMPVSGGGDLSPEGDRVVYSPLFRDFRTWKRYQGGWATDLYIFDLDTHEATQVTDHVRSDRDPMWIDDEIVFTSDRDGKLNLYAYDVEDDTIRQLTSYTDWDVRWPAADEQGRVVYELAGELRIYDTNGGMDTGISITVPTDALAMRPERVDASGDVEGWALSPKGNRALVVARGDIFSLPTDEGFTRNLTNSSDAHERLASWSPNGRWILYVSDITDEEALYLMPRGTEDAEPRLLTDEATGRLYAPKFSPDSEMVAYSDKEGVIRVVDVESSRVREVADEPQGQVTDYVWSPDSNWLAFSMTDRNGYNSIHVWSRGENETRRVTGELFNEFQPTWGPNGDFLYYMSDRGFQPQIGSIEWNYLVDRETGVYALALREDVEHPLPPRDDEVEIEVEEEENGDDEEKAENGEEELEIEIDFDGLADRLVALPIELDNYYGMSMADDKLLFVRSGPFYYGRGSDIRPSIHFFDFDEREVKKVADAGGYALSHDGKKILVRGGGAFELLDVAPDAKGERVSDGDMHADVDYAQEWETIFDEVWRRFRDFFYVGNMHGYDWEAIGERYRELLPHVAHRSDLNYVIGEMIAELNVSHAYISGGDYEIPDRPDVALPGARIEFDADDGRYRLAEIYPGHNAETRYRSPLTEVGMNAAAGDYLLAIDGVELDENSNPYEMLRYKSDRPVTLTLNERPRQDDDVREVTFEPRTQETPLRYLKWVEGNRQKVAEATDGRVGYLHIPDMGSNGIREFIKYFYGQIRKDGLVIDVRGNGGGNVSQMLIERLSRELLRVRYTRTYEWPGTYPNHVFHGPMVCLLNETSASDGDIFPAMFQKKELGPLIGKRSWGGVIGITSHGPLLDGGSVNVPQFGTNDRETAEWVIEGHGVDPDIVVENEPKAVLEGRDPQLERGIEEVMMRIRQDPPIFPPRPDDPVRVD
ncbi:MAG TPA: S41 family peptidase [Candidatus Krumholzibacteria bacterium]|nr:S41 family peptidase [Candidatus Krumholzibacteria bacterium]